MRDWAIRTRRRPDAVVLNEAGEPVLTCARCGIRKTGRIPARGAYVCQDCKGSDPYFFRQARSGR